MSPQPIQIHNITFVVTEMTVRVGTQGDKKTYKDKNGIADAIVKVIAPIFNDLNSPDFLGKCTYCLTQNVNECLNGLIEGLGKASGKEDQKRNRGVRKAFSQWNPYRTNF